MGVEAVVVVARRHCPPEQSITPGKGTQGSITYPINRFLCVTNSVFSPPPSSPSPRAAAAEAAAAAARVPGPDGGAFESGVPVSVDSGMAFIAAAGGGGAEDGCCAIVACCVWSGGG